MSKSITAPSITGSSLSLIALSTFYDAISDDASKSEIKLTSLFSSVIDNLPGFIAILQTGSFANKTKIITLLNVFISGEEDGPEIRRQMLINNTYLLSAIIPLLADKNQALKVAVLTLIENLLNGPIAKHEERCQIIGEAIPYLKNLVLDPENTGKALSLLIQFTWGDSHDASTRLQSIAETEITNHLVTLLSHDTYKRPAMSLLHKLSTGHDDKAAYRRLSLIDAGLFLHLVSWLEDAATHSLALLILKNLLNEEESYLSIRCQAFLETEGATLKVFSLLANKDDEKQAAKLLMCLTRNSAFTESMQLYFFTAERIFQLINCLTTADLEMQEYIVHILINIINKIGTTRSNIASFYFCKDSSLKLYMQQFFNKSAPCGEEHILATVGRRLHTLFTQNYIRESVGFWSAIPRPRCLEVVSERPSIELAIK